MKPSNPKLKKPYGEYNTHRYNAAKHTPPVEFLLTFEEWWSIWESSGKYPQRGCRKGQYVMARYGDTGAYVVGNVRIISVTENLAERRWSKETRAKLSASNTGRYYSPETRAKLSKAHKGNTYFLGKSHSEETKAKLRVAKLGNTHFLGKKHSEETKAKLSKARKGRPNTAWKGKKHSEETKKKISAAGKGRKHSAATRAKIGAGSRRAWNKRRFL